jgi:hypothetical protein
MSMHQLARCALLLLVLAGLGVQQWAAHSHWHAQISGAQLAVPGGDSGEGTGVHDCRWCQIGSHAVGAAPPQAALRCDAGSALYLHLPATHSVAHCDSAPAWNWQSRGPPAA